MEICLIDAEGLDEEIRCEMCRNPMRSNTGCDGGCTYDEKLYEKIVHLLNERIKPLPDSKESSSTHKALDTISRQLAIDLIERMKPFHQDADDIAEMIANMPSAQPNLQSTCNKLATDTISRAAAIDAMDGFNACGYVEEPFESLEKALKEIPAAEPERKTGRWMQISPARIYECSECAQMVMTDDISCYKYCHGCGAYMGGDDE